MHRRRRGFFHVGLLAGQVLDLFEVRAELGDLLPVRPLAHVDVLLRHQPQILRVERLDELLRRARRAAAVLLGHDLLEVLGQVDLVVLDLVQHLLGHPLLEHAVPVEALDVVREFRQEDARDLARLDVVEDVVGVGAARAVRAHARDGLVHLIEVLLRLVEVRVRLLPHELLLGVEGVLLRAEHPLELVLRVLVRADVRGQREGDVLRVRVGRVLHQLELRADAVHGGQLE